MSPDFSVFAAQMKARESNFQFDGMLTQAGGQVYAKLRNEADGVPMNLSVPFAVEHSSYWVHTRYVSVDTLHFVAVSAVSLTLRAPRSALQHQRRHHQLPQEHHYRRAAGPGLGLG